MNVSIIREKTSLLGGQRSRLNRSWVTAAAAMGLLLWSLPGSAEANAKANLILGEPLPPLTITEGGQVILDGDGYSLAPWSWPVSSNKVQVLQYVAGTRKGGDLYDPMTERMRRELDFGRYDITAVVNLEVTSAFVKPFVRSAVVDEQRIFTRATLVLDEQGIGQAAWNLTQQAAFVVMDRKGLVVDVILGVPSEADFERSFQVLRDLIALE